MSATLDQTAAAVHELIAKVDLLVTRVTSLESQAWTSGQGGGSRWSDGDRRDNDLVDRKFFTPEALSTKDIFREWAEDFTDYIASRDKELGTLLSAAKYLDVATHASHASAFGAIEDEKKANLYRVMKKLLHPHPEARVLVQYVPDKNPFEAWRQVHSKLDPMNDQAAGHAVRTNLDPRKWAVQHVTQIPSMLARWEGLQREHFARTQERVLTPSAARALLMEMIPTRMAEHVKVQTMLLKREDLT